MPTTSFSVSYLNTPRLATAIYWATVWHRREVYRVFSFLVTGIALWRLAEGQEAPLWTFWLGVIATFWLGWLQGARRSRRAAGMMVQLEVEPDGITVRIPGWTLSIAWPEVRRIDVLKPALILRRPSGDAAVAIPTGLLSAEQQALLEEYVRGADRPPQATAM